MTPTTPRHPDGRGIYWPTPKPRTPQEIAFLNLGERAHRWLVEAGAAGVTRIRAKMARAVELAAALGDEAVGEALGMAAIAGQLADDDQPSILGHLASTATIGDLVVAEETHSVQPGTHSWKGFGQ
ncbi:hypothetical protein [Streptomyces sp. KR55]|uniref:hypothetical protein n=1 Tax=Streptomyces sp. KR55 TaxID=3457425 RepID=UPI003FD42CAE